MRANGQKEGKGVNRVTFEFERFTLAPQRFKVANMSGLLYSEDRLYDGDDDADAGEEERKDADQPASDARSQGQGKTEHAENDGDDG